MMATNMMFTKRTAAAAFPSTQTRTFGENGAVEFTEGGVGDARVALFTALVRSLPEERLVTLFEACIEESMRASPAYLADLFVLAFQTRNCRGGKGERQLFYKLLLQLYGRFPDTVLALLPLVSEYGYFKDYFLVLEQIPSDAIDESPLGILRSEIIKILASQLLRDFASLTDPRPQVSLCAKYAPREKGRLAVGQNAFIGKALLAAMFPDNQHTRKAEYRKMISALTRYLDVPEVKMAGRRYAEIDFKTVPSVCALRNRKAFLNEKVKGEGIRHPENEDRMAGRLHFREAIKSHKVHGKQVYPHEIVKLLRETGFGVYSSGRGASMSADELALFDAQWADIRKSVVEKLSAAASASSSTDDDGTAVSVSLNKLVPLVDVSGSMEGDPMNAAIALGILVSEVNHPAFRDRFLTFDSSPQWVDLSGCATIADKVAMTSRAPWGGSTNVLAAFDQMLKVIEENRLPVDEVPDLIIFSDMQFNQAEKSGWSTTYEVICKRFHELGMRLSGEPYPAPRIVFWNLRGNTRGFAAQADTENVQMLSGFSPALLELVMAAEPLPVVSSDAAAERGERAQVNPYQTFRAAMDKDIYDKVRDVLTGSTEGLLKHYTFVRPQPSAPSTDGMDLAGAAPESKRACVDSADSSSGWVDVAAV